MASRSIAVLAMLMAFAVPASASARELHYRAPATCPSRETVERSIDSRAPEGRRVAISIRKDGAIHRGEIALGSGDETITRSVEGKTCNAVVDALLLVAAIDRQEPEPKREPEPEPERSLDPIAPPPSVSEKEATPAPKAPPSPTRRYDLGLAFLRSGGLPADRFMSFGGVGRVELGTPIFGKTWLTPSVQIDLTRSLASNLRNVPVDTELHLTRVGLAGCASIDPPYNTHSEVSFCARAETGLLVGTADGNSRTRAWLAVGPEVQVRLFFMRGKFRPFLGGTFALMFPLLRDRFRVIDDTVRVDAIALGFGTVLGIGFQ